MKALLLTALLGSAAHAQTLTVDGVAVELPRAQAMRPSTCPFAKSSETEAGRVSMQLPEPPPEVRAKIEAAKRKMQGGGNERDGH